MFPIGAAVAGAGLLGGYLSGNKAAEAQDRRFTVARGLQWQNINDTRRGFAGAEGLLRQALGASNAGYGNAFANLNRAGVSARQGVMDQQRQAMGGLGSSLASSGLGSTTVLQNAQRGLYADTSRQLAAIDENIGNMLANLSVGQGQAKAAGLGALSNLKVGATQALTGQRNDMQSLLLGTAPQPSQAGAGMSQLGTLMMLLGGNFGGAAGGKGS